MLLLWIPTLLFAVSAHFNFAPQDWSIAQKLNNICLLSVPRSVDERLSWQALVCGASNLDPQLQIFLTQSGLVHIFVVSGGQLILLMRIFSKVGIPFPIRLAIGLIYAFFCRLQAPVTRAYWGILAFHTNRFFGLCWRTDLQVLFVGILYLSLFPNHTNSLSFFLSWLTALVLSFQYKNVLQQSSILYFALLLPLWGFGNLHPIVLLFNLLLAPLIGYILFPLALSLLLAPFLAPLFDETISFLRWLSEQFDPGWVYIGQIEDLKIQRSQLWLGLLFAHLTIHFFHIWHAARHFKKVE